MAIRGVDVSTGNRSHLAGQVEGFQHMLVLWLCEDHFDCLLVLKSRTESRASICK